MKNVHIGIALALILMVIGCSNNSDKKNGIYLYYIDNGGGCLPCLQVKQASKKVVKKLQDRDLSVTGDVIRTDLNEEEELRSQCKVFARHMVAVKYKNDKVISYKRLNGDIFVMFPEETEKLINDMADTVALFVEENR